MRLTREGIHVSCADLRCRAEKHNIAKPFLQTINAGEDEERDPCSTAGGNVDLCSHYMRNSMEF